MSNKAPKFLLIDETETPQQLLTQIGNSQFELEHVATYQAGLEKLGQGEYTLCLLDERLLPQHKLEFVQQIAQQKGEQQTPLVLLTNANNGYSFEQAFAAGVADCLPKAELTPHALTRTMHRVQRFNKLNALNHHLQQEVSHYKQQELQLREAEKEFRTFFNIDIYGVEVLNTEGIIIDCNSTFEELVGYNRVEIVGRHTTAFATKRGQRVLEATLTEIEAKGYVESEVELHHKDEHRLMVWKRSRAIFDQNGQFSKIISYSRDITERMQAVKQISTLARALEQSPMPLIITDLDGGITYVNFEFSEMTGYSYEDVVNKNLRRIKLPIHDYDDMLEAVRAGDVWREEFLNKRKNGEEYWESLTVTPMFDTHGRLSNMIAVQEDITPRLDSESESLESQVRLGGLMSQQIDNLTMANEELRKEIEERSRIESALRRSRARLKAQYKGIPIPTYSWQISSDDFVLIDYNNAAEKSTNGRVRDILGKRASEVFEDRPQVLADFARCAQRKRILKREAPYRLISTGETRYFVTTYNYVPPNLVLVHIEDITEHKRPLLDEEARRLSVAQIKELEQARDALLVEISKREALEQVIADKEERIRQITTNIDSRLKEQYRGIPIPTYSWQRIADDFVLIDFNDAAAESMGRIVDFLGKTAAEIFKNRSQVLADFDRCYKEKTNLRREAPYQLVTSGETRYFVTTYNYTPPNLVIVHIHDITEYKQAEAELARHQTEMEALSAEHEKKLALAKKAYQQEAQARQRLEQQLKTEFADIRPAEYQQLKAELTKSKAHLQRLATEHSAKITQINQQLKKETAKRKAAEAAVRESQAALGLADLDALTKMNEQLQRELGELQQAEQAIRHNRAKLKAQYQSIPIPTYSWQRAGEDFILVDYNRAAEEISDGKISDLMGSTANKAFANRPQILADLARCFERKEPVRREAPYQLIHTEGKEQFFVSHYHFVEPNMVIVYIQDITDQRKTEEALLKSEEQIFLFCRLAADKTISFVNDAFCWLFEQERTDFMDKPFPFIHEQDQQKFNDHLNALTEMNPVGAVEFRVIKTDGTLRWQQWILLPLFDQHGRLLEIQMMGQNITTRKKDAA